MKLIINYIKKDRIECVLDITEIKKDIVLFNQNEKNKNEIKNNVKVFLNNENINIIEEDNKWKIDYNFFHIPDELQ